MTTTSPARMESDESRRRPRILIVDDEVAMVRSLELLLRNYGEIKKAYSVPEAEEELAKEGRIDCIITDVSMPEASGLELVDQIRKRGSDIPIIVMTAYSSVPQAVEAMQRGAHEYLVKPFENTEMVNAVQSAITKKGLRYGESQTLPEGWICNSRSMGEFVQKVERVKESSLVLLVGEIGVGKSRAGRWIHEHSGRSRKEFLAVDARTHEEDAALLTKPLSKVGTIFVGEIFSLGRRLQDKLMEIIAEEKISVIGASSSRPEFQQLSDFREDLFQKLQGVVLRMPSLSERLEDFEALTTVLLSEIAMKHRIRDLSLDPSALQKLRDHGFAANVAELARLLERAAIESKAGTINADNIHFESEDLKGLLPFSIPLENGWNRLELLRESLERGLIQRALEKYPNMSNSQIATILGTTRRILELRMKEYGIRET